MNNILNLHPGNWIRFFNSRSNSIVLDIVVTVTTDRWSQEKNVWTIHHGIIRADNVIEEKA